MLDGLPIGWRVLIGEGAAVEAAPPVMRNFICHTGDGMAPKRCTSGVRDNGAFGGLIEEGELLEREVAGLPSSMSQREVEAWWERCRVALASKSGLVDFTAFDAVQPSLILASASNEKGRIKLLQASIARVRRILAASQQA